MSNKKLRKLIIKALNVLALNDRDLRTIGIWCNPNNIWHTKALGGYPNKEILNELKIMEKKGLVARQIKTLNISYGSLFKKKFELWSLTSKLIQRS